MFNKNKNIILIIVLIFISIKTFAKGDNFELTNVKKEYIGTYIPVDFELRLYQTKKFYDSLYESRNYGKTQPHDVLLLQENKCYSNLGFHDGYAITSKDFKNFKFITDKACVFCIDNNGYLYRKISNFAQGYNDYVEYVMKIILSNYKTSSEIKIVGNILIINGQEYKVNLDGTFFSTKDVAIWFYSDKDYVLKINGIDGEMFSGKHYEDSVGVTIDVFITRFPGMFELKQSEIPDYSEVSKETLRLLRNLIFSRNGYIFKSKDLQDYFNDCSWYKQNPKFDEANMRKDEKEFISLMQLYESK